jgi:transposase-like protein
MMAKPEQLANQKKDVRINRYFSEGFKRSKIEEVEKNLTTVWEISKEYQVSRVAVYKWIYKYSKMRKKGVRQVIEIESDTRKLIGLNEKIRELERIIGQKQVLLDFHEKMIELAEQEYMVDIKKKFGSKPSAGSGKTETHTPTK